MSEYKIGDIVEMKKNHPCSKEAKTWKIIELSGDVRMVCTNCGHVLLMKRFDFDKNFVRVVKK